MPRKTKPTEPAKIPGHPDRKLKFNRFFAANLIVEVFGALEEEDEDELENIDGTAGTYGIQDWRKRASEWLQDEYGVDKKCLMKLNELLSMNMSDSGALQFVLRGFECPLPADLVTLRQEFSTGQF
jgi:hypothetical protein